MSSSPNAAPSVTGVLLAAGGGSRLRLGPKALLELDGIPLVRRQAGRLLAGGCHRVIIVAGAGAERIDQDHLPPGAELVLNPDWREGLSTSLRAGLNAVAPGDAALVALVDQPGLGRALVQRLLDAHAASSPGVVSATYARPDGSRRRGHPLVMDADLVPDLAATATGDTGAREWLAAHPERIRPVDCDDLDDGTDVDTPEDLDRWNRSHPGLHLRQSH